VRLEERAWQAGTEALGPLLVLRQRLSHAEAERLRACGDVARADLKLRWLTGALVERGGEGDRG
jgi:hypothetical protein